MNINVIVGVVVVVASHHHPPIRTILFVYSFSGKVLVLCALCASSFGEVKVCKAVVQQVSSFCDCNFRYDFQVRVSSPVRARGGNKSTEKKKRKHTLHQLLAAFSFSKLNYLKIEKR